MMIFLYIYFLINACITTAVFVYAWSEGMETKHPILQVIKCLLIVFPWIILRETWTYLNKTFYFKFWIRWIFNRKRYKMDDAQIERFREYCTDNYFGNYKENSLAAKMFIYRVRKIFKYNGKIISSKPYINEL